ncbi:ribosylnicotinamide kinase [Coemansia javaensis]|uniref:Ribosylnicotinamide kinase n=1 Tax=Coemansia javaensis TaxID=2761396 RepID=A0A9W8LML0_9FUNG|nr:ribosylnicotinamide kinase [Coemansia javaensis]
MPEVVVFGLSGPSCAGKTALALGLAKVFPRTAVIHQDDFYKPDSQIPQHATADVQDWDCPEAFDMAGLARAIRDTRARLERTGALDGEGAATGHAAARWANPPADMDRLLSPEAVAAARSAVARELGADTPPPAVLLVDGILLFHDGSEIRDACSAGALVFARRDTLRRRRESRAAYTTKEGVWSDPPGYFDAVVWPNFIRYHAALLADYPQIAGPDAATAAGAGRARQTPASGIVVCSSDAPIEASLTACATAIAAGREMNRL